MLKKLVPLALSLALLFCATAEVCAKADFLAQYRVNPASLLRADAETSSEKVRKVKEVLRELAERRENFFKNGDFADVFAVVYYQVTANEFELILSDKLENPNATMDLIVEFHEIYKKNRAAFAEQGVEAVEPHWRDYYRKAAEINRFQSEKPFLLKPLATLWKIKNVLSSAYDAHINYDLPVALRAVLNQPNVNKETFYRDFRRSDEVMRQSDSPAVKDLSRAAFRRSRLFARICLNYGEKLFSVMPKVMKMRLNAWKKAQLSVDN